MTFEICKKFFPLNSAHVLNQCCQYSFDGASKNVTLHRIGDTICSSLKQSELCLQFTGCWLKGPFMLKLDGRQWSTVSCKKKNWNRYQLFWNWNFVCTNMLQHLILWSCHYCVYYSFQTPAIKRLIIWWKKW